MLTRRHFVSFALTLALAFTASAQSPADPAKLAAIKERMQKFIDEGELSGVVTVVGRKDGVVHHEALGLANLEAKTPMTKDTVFRIASMTKPITAIAIMILADEGKLSPTDPVEKYLPEFKGQMLVAEKGKDSVTLKKPARPITLADLLTHTSGLPGGYPAGLSDLYTKRQHTLKEATLVASQQPLQFEPGSKWSYCNAGIDTLGRIVEVVSGQSFESFLQSRIFDPLGMKDTTFYPSDSQRERLALTYGKKDGKLVAVTGAVLECPKDAKHPVPAGGLYSTGADLAKLYQMMLHKGELNGKRILSEKSVADMTTIHTGDLTAGFTPGSGFGYGWAVVKEPVGVAEMLSPGTFGHGGAFGTQGWIDPKNDVFIVLLIQRTGLQNSDASAMRKALQEQAIAAVRK